MSHQVKHGAKKKWLLGLSVFVVLVPVVAFVAAWANFAAGNNRWHLRGNLRTLAVAEYKASGEKFGMIVVPIKTDWVGLDGLQYSIEKVNGLGGQGEYYYAFVPSKQGHDLLLCGPRLCGHLSVSNLDDFFASEEFGDVESNLMVLKRARASSSPP